MTRTKKTPAHPHHDHYAGFVQWLNVLRILAAGPGVEPRDLAERLGVTRRTVHRLLRAINEAPGLTLNHKRVGMYAYYSLPRERLRKALGI